MTTDSELRARVRARLPMHPRGSLAHIDFEVTCTILETKPVAVTDEQVKHELAVHWLNTERPKGLLARIKWWRNLWTRIGTKSD